MLTLRSPQHVWLVRLCTLTALVLSLTWGRRAFAAAPMCGMHAQSVVAPPVGTSTNTDSLSAPVPCTDNGPLRVVGGAPNREAPRALSFPDQPVRALPVAAHFGPCPVHARVPAAAAARDLVSSGFARSIDRPPRV